MFRVDNSGSGRHLRSIKTTLLTWIGTLIAAGFGMFGLVFYEGILEPTTDNLAAAALEKSATGVADHAAKLIGQLERVALTAQEWGESEVFELSSAQGFVKLFAPVMQAREQITSINFTDDQGNELFLQRGDTSLDWNVRVTNVAHWGKRQLWIKWQSPDVFVSQEWREEDYDPRRRPWYQEAMKLSGGKSEVAWTEPYIFFVSKEPGITISTSWNKDDRSYVIAFNVKLLSLSHYTRAMAIGESGRAAILTADGKILAAPRHPTIQNDEDIKRVITKTPLEAGLNIMGPAFEGWKAKGSPFKDVGFIEAEGKTWVTLFRPIRMANREFLAVVVAPRNDFVPGSTLHLWILFGLVGSISLAAYLTVQTLGRRLSEPLVALANESERIGRLELEHPVNIVTGWQEFKVLGDAQEHMRQLLSAAQKDVNEKAAEMRNEREAAIKLAIEAQKARKDVETAKTELQDKMVEVERFNRLAMGREHRMLQLKYDINLLSRTLGRPEPFAASEATAAANDGEATLASTIDLEQIYQRFGEVVKNPAIQAMFENFCTTIGIPAAVIDLKGEVLAASRWQRACTDFHRVNEETCRRCIESDTELSLKLKEGEAFTMYGCKNGLTDCASPIIIEGTHVANAFVGQFLLQSPDIAFFKKQANEVGFDEVAYLAAIGEVPIMDEKRLPGILGFLTSFATLVGEMSLSQLHAEAAERGSRNERTAALNLAEDAEQARQQLEEYKEQLEKLIEERTADLKNLLEEQGAIFSSSPMGIILSGDGKLVRVNKKMGEVFGYDEEEMIGKATGILSISPESYAQLGATVGPDLSKGDAVQVEWQLRRKSGESFWGRLSAKSISIQGYQFSTVWMIEDITEKKQAEQAIRDAEARLRNILETSPVGIAAVADNKPVYANARYAEMLGFSREEAIAGSVKDIYANREDRERLIEQLKNDGHLPPFNFLD